jgi:hypothetical protein
MFKECRFILPTGYKCKSPALRGQQFCFFHNASRRYSRIKATSFDPLLLPSIEDAGGVQIALDQVFRALTSRQIDRRQAGVLFYGLQIAARLARKSEDKPTETVREVCEEEYDYPGQQPVSGSNLAPEKTTCEPPADCVNCRRRSFCQDFELWEDDVEELEERLELEREANEAEDEQTGEDEE